MKVCVFCGSSSGASLSYTEVAEELGKKLVENNWGLVYGGGTTGLMGIIARATATRGGYVHGIIPKALIEREQSGKSPDPKYYGKTTVVNDMHTRKRMMGLEANAFVALPGGYGTAEELFETITWNQLGIHAFPIVLLNVNGFYDGLIQWISDAVKTGFISEGNSTILVEAKTAEEVICKIKNYKTAKDRFNLNWSDQSPETEKASNV